MHQKTEWLDDRCALIYTQEPFSFAANLRYLNRSANECLFQTSEYTVTRAIESKGTIYIISIHSEDDRTLLVQFLNQAPEDAFVRSALIAYIRDWFDLDTDLQPFYAIAKIDPLLHKPIKQFQGLRIMGIPDLYEALVWGILGQQIHLDYAYTLKHRFVKQFGSEFNWENRSYWLFPKPGVVASKSVEDLKKLGTTTRKAEYLLSISKLLANDKLRKAHLTAVDFTTAEKKLTAIRGIGPWTANYVLMRCLRFPNAFPIDDVGLQNAIKRVCQLDEKPAKEMIRKMAFPWQGYESYATFYLWRLLY